MRTLILTLALALAVPAAWAQDKAAAKAPANPAPAQVAEKQPADKPAAAKKSRRGEDARHCLEKTSNNEVIKCAEVYL